jgi:hypothetical protein
MGGRQRKAMRPCRRSFETRWHCRRLACRTRRLFPTPTTATIWNDRSRHSMDAATNAPGNALSTATCGSRTASEGKRAAGISGTTIRRRTLLLAYETLRPPFKTVRRFAVSARPIVPLALGMASLRQLPTTVHVDSSPALDRLSSRRLSFARKVLSAGRWVFPCGPNLVHARRHPTRDDCGTT